MYKEHMHDFTGFAATHQLVRKGAEISTEGLRTCERIKEIMMMCDREEPVYEQISSFSIALYTLGYFDCPDLMSFEDVDAHQAADILQNEFIPVHSEDVPRDYAITESKERFLLVIGDPLHPLHFAVLTDTGSDRPFFSKLPFFGGGFDSLPELMDEFAGYDGVSRHEIQYFKKREEVETSPAVEKGKIYIVKD